MRDILKDKKNREKNEVSFEKSQKINESKKGKTSIIYAFIELFEA